jgi:hypothetical protein
MFTSLVQLRAEPGERAVRMGLDGAGGTFQHVGCLVDVEPRIEAQQDHLTLASR